MPPTLAESTQNSLTFTPVQSLTDPSTVAFLEACKRNDADLALQLAPSQTSGALTFGLNRAVGGGHLDLARKLLTSGTKWDSEIVNLASSSLDAVKFLVDSGFDIHTSLIRGGTLLW
jgi:hypothetical protein